MSLVQANLSPNTTTQTSGQGTYSDSTMAQLPNSTVGAAQPYQVRYGSGTSVTSIQVSAGTTTTTGDMAVAVVASYSSSSLCTAYTASVTSANETFTAATTALGESSTPPPYYNCYQMFYAYNITGAAADQPTCNWTTTIGGSCVVQYYHGMLTTNPLDQHVTPTQASSTGSCVPTAVTTVQANEVGVLVCGPNSATTITPPTGYVAEYANGSYLQYADYVYNAIQTGIAPSATFSPGAQPEVTLFATFKAVTPTAGGIVWSSATPTCAVVSNTGLVTALPVQTTCTSNITATVGAVSAYATVTVTVSTVDTSIVVTPGTASASLGGTQQFTAQGNLSHNGYQATWGSSNPQIASINPSSGLATCAAVGSVTISATVSGFTSSTPATLSCSTATVINAASCSLANVLSALNSVSAPTTTVVIPSGTCSWTSQLSYTIPPAVTNLTIQGQTTVACTGTAGTSSYGCAATDNTVIQDNDVNSTNESLMVITTGSGSSYFRMTGLTIVAGGTAPNNGTIDFFGATQNLRFDHNHVNSNGTNNGMIQLNGQVSGLADHNLMAQGNIYGVSSSFKVDSTLIDPPNGDQEFSAPTAWGTSSFFFMEANVFTGGASIDCSGAGRYVFRYNNVSATYVAVETHPTKSYEGGRRGCRAYEAYHNYFFGSNTSPSSAATSTSNSTALLWGNTVASGYQHFFVGNTFRAQNGQPEGAAINANPPAGWGYCGTDTLYPSSYGGGVANGTGSNWDGNSPTVTGYPCLDGVGRGQTTQTLNDQYFPNRLNLSTGTIAWPVQYLEPVYLFMNTILYGNEGYLNDNVTAYERDVYPDCGNPSSDCSAAFNGTKGTGYGLLSARPATCTAGGGGVYGASPTGSYGVAYFATDNNTLYVCTTRLDRYGRRSTRRTHPHPLDTGP